MFGLCRYPNGEMVLPDDNLSTCYDAMLNENFCLVLTQFNKCDPIIYLIFMFANHFGPTITGLPGRSDSKKGRRSTKKKKRKWQEKKHFFQINLITKNMNVIICAGVGMAMMENIVPKARRTAVIWTIKENVAFHI